MDKKKEVITPVFISMPDSTNILYEDTANVFKYYKIDSYYRSAGICNSTNMYFSRNEALDVQPSETQIDIAIATSKDSISFKNNIEFNKNYPLVASPTPADNCPYTFQVLLIESDPQTPGTTSWYSYKVKNDSLPSYVKYTKLTYGGNFRDRVTKEIYNTYYVSGVFECSLVSEKDITQEKVLKGSFTIRVLFPV